MPLITSQHAAGRHSACWPVQQIVQQPTVSETLRLLCRTGVDVPASERRGVFESRDARREAQALLSLCVLLCVFGFSFLFSFLCACRPRRAPCMRHEALSRQKCDLPYLPGPKFKTPPFFPSRRSTNYAPPSGADTDAATDEATDAATDAASGPEATGPAVGSSTEGAGVAAAAAGTAGGVADGAASASAAGAASGASLI